MQKITPFLWFDTQAEEAANLYVPIFKNSRILSVTRHGDVGPEPPPGGVTTVDFELEGQRFSAMNAGPRFKFTEAISFVVDCETQADVDYYWEKLTADGGSPSMCGWLKDKYGLSWQIVPRRLIELTQHPDKAKAQRAMAAMLQMQKIDIAALERAAG
jgi:predicted 3-demethylubiquinone-9 3-methyltransferase (glyoxalase superfamily)